MPDNVESDTSATAFIFGSRQPADQPGPGYRSQKTSCYPNAPALRMFFTYNPYEVHLLWLEFME